MTPWWWLSLSVSSAQDVPVPDGRVQSSPRRAFDATEYEALQQVQALFDQKVELQDEEIEKLRLQLQQRAIAQGLVTSEELEHTANPTAGLTTASRTAAPAHSAPGPGGTGPSGVRAEDRPSTDATRSSTLLTTTAGATRLESPSATAGKGKAPAPTAPQNSLGAALVFEVPEGSDAIARTSTVVPAGSYVKVRILTGVEANARDDIPMLVQADHAMVGPNHRRIDLRGCMVLLQVKGDLSVDRVVGKAIRLSCVRDDGEHVHRQLNGYLAGEDSTFGVTGQLISRQGRVIASASVASLAEAAGTAVAAAQQTTQVVTSPLGGAPVESKNVTGSQLAYVAGSSSSAAAGMIAHWYLQYADQLLPAIAVGSGRDVWVVLLDSVEVPPLGVR